MLKLTHHILKARVPLVPPILRWGAYKLTDGLLGWGDGPNFIVTDQLLPGGVPPSPTRVCIISVSMRVASSWGFGSATFWINGVAVDFVLARRDNTVATVIMGGLLPTGREGDSIEVSVTGASGVVRAVGMRAFLADGLDLVTTWPTPVDISSDINVSPSVALTGLLQGAVTIVALGLRSGGATNDISNTTMIDVGPNVNGVRACVGYRLSAADESVTPVGDDAATADQTMVAVSLNPTLVTAYL